MQRATGCDQSRETSYRLQGIYLIDNVRLALRLYVGLLCFARRWTSRAVSLKRLGLGRVPDG